MGLASEYDSSRLEGGAPGEDAERRLRENYERLIFALSAGKGVQAIADIGSEFLGNPVSIADSSYKILAISTAPPELAGRAAPENAYGVAALESIAKRQLGMTSVDFVRKTGRIERLGSDHGPHIMSREALGQRGFDAPCGFLDCGVYIKGILVAILTVADIVRPFQEPDLAYCSQLARLVSLELQKHEVFSSNYGVAYEVLLSDLLENKVSDSLQVRLRLQSMNRSLKADLYVAAVRRAGARAGQQDIPVIHQDAVRSFFPGSISVVYHGDIVLLIGRDAGEPVRPADGENFLALLRENDMKLGVSEVFHDPIRMHKYYQQASKAIELGCALFPARTDYSYYQLSVFHAMELCSGAISLRDLAHPLIRRLNDSEDAADHELLKTLYVWLYCGRDTERIIRTLQIHRSTLYYRLNKIRDMLDGDLDDGELTFQLMFSFKLIEYYTGLVGEKEPYWFKEVWPGRPGAEDPAL